MKKLIFILLSLMLVGCQAEVVEVVDNSLSRVIEEGKMIVGFTEYPPMGFKENGEVTGFDIDIAKVVGERLGVAIEFVYIDWDAKVLELEAGNIDMIWNGLTITEDREKEILFSKPYFNNRIVILTLNDSTINSIADLSGKNVGVELQSSGQSALEKSDVFTSLTEMVKYTTITEAVLDLKAGGIDAIVADEIFARYAVSKEVNAFKVPDEVFGSENYGIGFRLEDVALRDIIDEIIDAMAADGTALEISLKWFGEDLLLR
jgi:polar amino acid transport system substrate-binding protein